MSSFEHMAVDGKNALYRAVYAGINDERFKASGSDFFLIFIKFMNHYYSSFKPKQIHMFWDDRSANLWRRKIYPEYKATREPNETVDPIITRLTKVALAVCKSLGFRQYYREGQEADDLIYAFCRSTNEPTVVISSDSDLRQIPYNMGHATLYNPLSKERKQTGQVVLEGKLPYDPAIYKALVGDKSDNVEGYYGIGPVKGKALTQDLAARMEYLKSAITEGKEPADGSKYRRNRLLIDLSLNPHLLDNLMYCEKQFANKPHFTYKDVIVKLRDMDVKGVINDADKYVIPFANLAQT